MNNKSLRNFAEYARAEVDKLGFSAEEIKDSFISMLMNFFAAHRGICTQYDDSLIPTYIKEKFSSDISFEELSHIENIGWIFQYFVNSDRARTVDAIGGRGVDDAAVTAATQVFTPEWIVRFLVDNSLGRLRAEHCADAAVSALEYLIVPKMRKNEKINPEDITFFDPCCGSGHILVYAFDVFMQMYSANGYSKTAAVHCIKKNLFGTDIDPHAVRLAAFQLRMKALQYGVDESFELNIHLCANAPIGSLAFDGDEFFDKKFDIVCTNPPYLSKIGGELKNYLNAEMKPYSKDLFTAFMYRGLHYCKADGYMAYMTPTVWMYLVSHRNIRNYILDEKSLCVLAEPNKGEFFSEASVDICAFVVQNKKSAQPCVYIGSSGEQRRYCDELSHTVQKYNNGEKIGCVYERSAEYFGAIDGRPMAYFVPSAVQNLFSETKIGDLYTVKQGMTTGCNKKFLRYWFEVPFGDIGFSMKSTAEAKASGKRWFPYNKGGKFRKWYGNNEYVVMYENDGREMKEYTSRLNQGTWVRLKSRDYYFRESVTWSFISSSYFGVRYSPCGSIFDVAGSSLFGENLHYILGYLCSSTAFYFLKIINPSMNYQIRDIKQLPYRVDELLKAEVERLVDECVGISKEDWNSSELSFDYACDPVFALADGSGIDECIGRHLAHCAAMRSAMQKNEERINRIFAKIYGVEDIVDCAVTDDKITLRKVDEKLCARNLLSYIVGCAFGRYSPSGGGVLKTVEHEEKSFDDIADFIERTVNENFRNGDSEILLSLCADGKKYADITDYLKKDFLTYHKKQFHSKPFYVACDGGIAYTVGKQKY